MSHRPESLNPLAAIYTLRDLADKLESAELNLTNLEIDRAIIPINTADNPVAYPEYQGFKATRLVTLRLEVEESY